MVERRIKEICLSAMESRFPKFKVKDFEIRKTFKYENETQDWVSDSYAIFIQVDRNEDGEQLYNWDVETFFNLIIWFRMLCRFLPEIVTD
jgi:hypothetical protein